MAATECISQANRGANKAKMMRIHQLAGGNMDFNICCHSAVPSDTSGEDFRDMDIVRFAVFLFGLLWSVHASAAPAPPLSQLPPVIPTHQELAAVDYFRDGKPTGCGLRTTGEAVENIWLNVLISVFLNETGATFGIFKVSAKKINMRDGAPLIQDGRITYTSIGKIHKAWLKTKSGLQPNLYKNGELTHSDGYMASMEFVSSMDLLAAIPQASFRVGLNKNEGDAEEIYEFNKRIDLKEANKLLACMNNLRNAVEENKSGKRS